MPFDQTMPFPLRSVCVYCGSSSHIDDDSKHAAADVGAALGSRKIRVIYGGGCSGLMGPLADATLKAGGEVTGIITKFIRDRERQHTGLTELVVVDDMHVRKHMMFDKAEAFVVLPGGFGTLDETFEVLTWKQIGLHNKPILIFNHQHFWSPMLDLLRHMISRGFAPPEDTGLYKVVRNIDEMLEALAAPITPAIDPSTKWY